MDHNKIATMQVFMLLYCRWLVTMVLESMCIISDHRLVAAFFARSTLKYRERKMLGLAIHPREISKHVIESCEVQTCPFLSNNICLILKPQTNLISLLPSLAGLL
jgi:hypothetical protein